MPTEVRDETPIMSFGAWATNAELIADCARLGYLRDEWLTLDPTYGYGTFWKRWRPRDLLCTDLDPAKSLSGGESVDFTAMPWQDREFDAVVFDPPYKLNGTPDDAGVDERYGVHAPTRWQDRMDLIRRGIDECARVCRSNLLIKCQDQVCSGKVRWQTLEFTQRAVDNGFGLVDRLDFPSYRAQPNGRRQVHARRNTSTLLVLQRGWSS